MKKIVLLFFGIFLLPSSPCFSNDLQQANTENITRYRLEILVHSSQLKLIEVRDGVEKILRVFPVGTSKTDYPVPYGKEMEVGHILVNPSWTPTKTMLEEQARKIEQGKKIDFFYRSYSPGEIGNPLGLLAIYPKEELKNPLRIHNTFKSIGKKILPDGSVKGSRISRGCARAELDTLLPLTSILTERPTEQLDGMIKTKRTHSLKLKHPATMIFIKG